MPNSITQVIPDIMTRETAGSITRLVPVNGEGLVNRVYEVYTPQVIYILRANTGEDDYGIYLKEKWCIEQAARLGIPGPGDFRVGKLGAIAYSLYPKIPGIVATQVKGSRDFIWRKLGEYASRYHQVEAYGFGSGFSADPAKGAAISDWLDYYLDYIFDNDRLVEEQIVCREDWVRSRKAIEGIRQWNISPHLCHGNPVLKNVIVKEDNEVALIDWGTACGHLAPQIDLTEILVEHSDDPRGLAMFLDGYGLSQAEFRAMEEQLWVLQVWRLLSVAKWALQDNPAARKEMSKYKRLLDRLFAPE
jgi:aminoglycoside phosphotransferase (APT) family kinase protein